MQKFIFLRFFCYIRCITIRENLMELIKRHLRENYDLSSYQIAQIFFLFKTMGSELSKIILMGILFHDRLPLYIFSLGVMLCLRCTTGGLHFYTYVGCLLASCLYLWLALAPLSGVFLNRYAALFLLLCCILVCYTLAPIASKYRPPFSKKQCERSKMSASIFIFLYTLVLYIMPENRYINTGFWIIILHSLQLIAAKIQKKGAC